MIPLGELSTSIAMAALAMASVGLWTLRVALTAQGRKAVGAGVAAVEAVVFAVVFSSVASDLGSPYRLGGYAIGVAAGTLLGLLVDERLALGTSEVQIVVDGHQAVAEDLRRLGWPATSIAGEGPSGPVTIVFVAVDDSRMPRLVASLRGMVPDAFWAVQQLRRTHASALPAGLVQVRR
jgi:uncharacterized protein YebE (UPF0316 family)